MNEPDWDKMDWEISAWYGFPVSPSTEDEDAFRVMMAARSRDWWFQVSSHGGKDGGWRAVCDHRIAPDETRCYSEFAGMGPKLTFAQAVTIAFHGSLVAVQEFSKENQ